MNTHNKSRLFFRLLVATGMMLTALGGTIIYSHHVEKSLVWYGNVPFPVGAKKYHPGEVVETSIMRCSSSAKPLLYHSSHELKCDGEPVQTLPTVDVTADPGCRPVAAKINIAPDTAEPKSCYFLGIATVPGLLRDHQVEWSTQRFTVVPSGVMK